MSQPAYQIAVLNPYTGDALAVFDGAGIYNLRYSRVLNDVGTLAMTLPSTPEIRDLFVLDCFIEVYRADISGTLQKEETYLCRLTQRFMESNEERFVVGGVSLNHLLMRRIIDPADDSGATPDGHSAKIGRADAVIAAYVAEQAGASASILRRTPGLTISTSPIGRPVAASLRFEYLFNQIQALAKAGVVDFAIERTTGANLLMSIGALGTDRTYTTNAPLNRPYVVLSPLRGNLTTPSITFDRKPEGNYVYALGQGQGTDRIIYQTAGDGTLDSPFNRIEFCKDMRNIDKADTLGLTTGAAAALREKRAHREFTYKPTGTEPGNIYHEDWDLGDALTVVWDEWQGDLRIIKVEVSINADGEQINTTVTDDFVFPTMITIADVELPTRVTLWHSLSTVIAGNGLTVGATTTRGGEVAYQSPSANGDTFTQSFLLAAGTYRMTVLGSTYSLYGKVDWYLDDVLAVSGQDWYDAGFVTDVEKTAVVTIPTDGYHVLKGAINGSTGGGHTLALVKIWLTQAVD